MPGTHRGQQGASYALELELPVVVSHSMWVLGLKPGPLHEEQALFTTELSLQPSFQKIHIFIGVRVECL